MTARSILKLGVRTELSRCRDNNETGEMLSLGVTEHIRLMLLYSVLLGTCHYLLVSKVLEYSMLYDMPYLK